MVTDVKWEWLYSTLTDGEYMLTKTVLDPKEDGTYDQATMYVTFVFERRRRQMLFILKI